MRKPKASQRHRPPAEKVAGAPPDKPAATTPNAINVRPVPPRRRPWLLGIVTAALVAWLAVLIWMALSTPPAAS
jgi:ferric-dicitrate binding protein FerR (iron transport regulator)